MEKLKRGQIVVIDLVEYVVDNMIEFEEESWVWQEYEIRKKNSYNEKYWLSVEENNNKIEYFLYSNYSKTVNTSNTEFEDNGKKYTLHESGEASVKSYFGPADVDLHEKCKYYDYISENKEEIISVEIWSNEKEYTIGKKIQDSQIKIKEDIDEDYIIRNKENQKAIYIVLSIFFALTFGLPFLGGIIGSIASTKTIDKYLSKNNSKYSYVTSVTNNSNNKKAKVYVSTLKTLDEVLKDIIDGVPEEVTEVIDDDTTTEKDGYAIETKREYAYIYMHDDEKIYIQVSNKKFVNNSGTAYHSSHNTHYHRSFSRGLRSLRYYNYASSARQASINSRSQSGGGTSSGK